MPQSVEVDIRLTVQDLFLVRLLQFIRKPLIVILLGVMMLLLFGIFLVSIAKYHEPNYLAFAEFCFIGLMIPLMLFWTTKRYYKTTKQVQEPMHYVLTATDLRVTSPTYSSYVAYDNTWKIQETSEYFLIWESQQAAHILPKRSFRNTEEISAVRSLVASARPVKGVHVQPA